MAIDSAIVSYKKYTVKRKYRIELIIVSIIILANSAFLAYQFRFNRKFLYEQAHILYEQGDKDRAIEKYQEFLKRFPEGSYTDRVHYDLARVLYDEKKYVDAVPRYREFLSRFPESECADKVRAELAEMQHVLEEVKRYIAELHDSDLGERAAKALGKIGEPAVYPLIAALKDEGLYVETYAQRALGKIGGPAVGPLIAALKDKNPIIRRNAAGALKETKDIRAVEPLITALRDRHPAVRMHAAWALATIKDSRAVEPLIVALKDKNSSVRLNVTLALMMIGNPCAVEPLVVALKDRSDDVRKWAARALGKIGNARAIEALITAIRTVPEAIWVLAEVGDPRAIGPLIAVLQDEDPGLRWNAAWALKEITGMDFGQDAAKWRQWWEQNKVDISINPTSP